MNKLMTLIFVSLLFVFSACTQQNNKMTTQTDDTGKVISKATQDKVVAELLKKYGESEKFRIERGVSQCASLWKSTDGSETDFNKFCADNFIVDSNKLDEVFNTISKNFESLNGHFNQIMLDLREKMDLDKGEVGDFDLLFASYNPSSHLSDDFFNNKIAFIISLNFPYYTLQEKEDLGKNWTRKQWAYARMGDAFTSRIPAQVQQDFSDALTQAENYIVNYNIYMGNLIDDKNQTFFPKDMKLITHWNLRDELKSQYAKPDGLTHQKMIYEVMKRIITQTIPEKVINSNEYNWNPYTNKTYKDGKEVQLTAEPDTRYKTLWNNYLAEKKIDEYYPKLPTAMARTFDEDLEIREKDVEQLFTQLVSSPIAKQIGELISKRLGRPLEPFDIWYDGFKSRGAISENELTKITSAKYPNVEAFQKDIPNIYQKLGFSNEKSNFIASKIQVDPARGAGHAWGAEMRDQKSHLRTRIPQGKGMDYKGYNIAVHELGHNTEQTITLHDVDYFMLHGVPNTAFTETWAFVFQQRDLDLLGMKTQNPDAEALQMIDMYWQMYEIMGVSLVDMQVWNWMYKNPNATPDQLKNQVIQIAKDIWNKYYAPVIGKKDEPILAIYSHMIDYPLYLPAYPIGHIVQYQIEQYIKGKNIGNEMMRMLTQGKIVPKIWMENAVGGTLSVDPILKSTQEALDKISATNK